MKKLIAAIALLTLALPVNAQTATFYSDWYVGRKMTNGQRFSQHRMTAAHPTIRLGKTITVINRRTGKRIRVKVTDRCRCSLDLSKTAFKALGGKLHQGVIPVRIRY